MPGKKALSSTEYEWSAIIVDVGESPIERPKKAVRPRVAERRKGTRTKTNSEISTVERKKGIL